MKAKKRISITLMIFPFLIAALLLSGCFPVSSLDENTIADATDSAAEAANSLADSAEQAADAAEVLADQHFGAVGIYDTDEAGTIEQLEQVCDVVLRELDELDIDKFLRGEYRKNESAAE